MKQDFFVKNLVDIINVNVFPADSDEENIWTRLFK